MHWAKKNMNVYSKLQDYDENWSNFSKQQKLKKKKNFINIVSVV